MKSNMYEQLRSVKKKLFVQWNPITELRIWYLVDHELFIELVLEFAHRCNDSTDLLC